jgi:thiosulfate dehydrogenase
MWSKMICIFVKKIGVRSLYCAMLFSIISVTHAETTLAPFIVPDVSTIPKGPLGEAILKGKDLLSNTRELLPKNVGNGLNCTNCHLKDGTVPYALPWVGLWGVFPEYRSRNAKMISLSDRINDCFQRSMNGSPISYASKEMVNILSYMRWLSTGVPVGQNVVGRGFIKIDTGLTPDASAGKSLYAQKCSSCHGQNGTGLKNTAGGYVFPPLWGSQSFNDGAGMSRTYTAAAFIKHNMPLGQEGTLTDQEAVDIAQFITHQPRPVFKGKVNDWPKGGKPKDARNID